MDRADRELPGLGDLAPNAAIEFSVRSSASLRFSLRLPAFGIQRRQVESRDRQALPASQLAR